MHPTLGFGMKLRLQREVEAACHIVLTHPACCERESLCLQSEGINGEKWRGTPTAPVSGISATVLRLASAFKSGCNIQKIRVGVVSVALWAVVVLTSS